MIRIATSSVALFVLFARLALAQEAVAQSDKTPPSQEALEKDFAETMSGATLVGRFTTLDEKGEHPLKEDRYTLGKVYKLPNGLWSFETRIQYGERDVKVPLALEVKWAGDTPVITLTDLLVPGIGTFTSRVLVYRGEYAGTWSAGDHGGQMFGRIEKAAISKPEEK